MPDADTAPVSAPRLFGIALALATAIGLASTVLLKAMVTAAGGELPWAQAATGWVDWYLWAALTPVVVGIARRIPIRRERWGRALAAHVLLGAVISAAELALFASVMTGYNQLFMGLPLPPFRTRYLTLIGRWLPLQMLIYALIVAVVSALDHGRRARERAVTAARLETELARAQAHALQAQIQPHFLFNTLNTIAMAVREGRDRAAVKMLARLSGILRRSMETAVRPETTLRRELRLVRDYLRLERYRMEDRLNVRWKVEEETWDAIVPTMLLQPLVENAVRHGIAERAEGGTLTIHAGRRDGSLVVEVEDTGAGLPPDARPGVGTENVRRRLATRYGPDAGLALEPRAGGGTVARVTLPYGSDERPGDGAGDRAHDPTDPSPDRR
jgi:two-component system LytT family sensor kinase